jgi:hypothetical protein
LSAKAAKTTPAGKYGKGGKGGKPAKVAGGGTLTLWSVAYGVIFGGLWWMGWLALQRQPGEDAMSVVWPYAAVGGAVFLLLFHNIAEALARGAAQQA